MKNDPKSEDIVVVLICAGEAQYFLFKLKIAKMLRILISLVIAVTVIAGIYPDDHWNHATELTLDNFDNVVKENVDAGKTLFVRWIASEGCW